MIRAVKTAREAGAESPEGGRRWPRIPFLFIFIVLIPNLLGLYYFLVVASPIYVSEASFVVRTPSQAAVPSMTGLNTVLEGVGLKATDTDAFVVHEYVMSRSAVTELEKNHGLRQALGPPGADFIARFPRPFEKPSSENLFRAYKRFVTVGYDSTRGISTLQVQAFNPRDAQRLAEALLDQGELLINRLNVEAENDAVNDARREVDETRARLIEAQARTTLYRNRNEIVDPVSAGAVSAQLIGKLSSDLATLKAERSGIAANTPRSPELPGLDQRILAYQTQLDQERAKIAGENNSLASKISEYERLTMDAQFLQRALASATAALDTARLEARKKQLYLQRVVEPSLPDSPLLPQRVRGLLTLLFSSLLTWGAVVLIAAGLREHRQ